ncbi:MAG: lysylphosphatidylglycerol synthase transmembrane domain-containing protein [Rudaea sp.]
MNAVVSLMSSRRVRVLIVVAVIFSLAVPLMIGGRESMIQIRNLPANTYLALFSIIAVSWLARAAKLHLLMARLGSRATFPQSFARSLLIDFAFITTPGGVGGYAASVYCGRRAGLSASGATTLTFIDQLLDLAFFSLAVPIAALSLVFTDVSRTLSILAFGSSVLTLVLVAIALIMHHRFLRWLYSDNVFIRRWPRLKDKQHVVREFIDNVKRDVVLVASGAPAATAAVIAMTCAQWITRYGVLWAAFVLIGHAVPFALTLLSQALVLHAVMWTGVPAGGGGAELGLSAALIAMVPSSIIATALILWRLTTFHLCLVAGLAATAWLAKWGKGEEEVGLPVLVSDPKRSGS